MEGDTMNQQHNRGERISRAIGYLALGVTGIAIFIADPVSSISKELGWYIIAWAAFLLAGIPAAVAAFRGRYRTEYVCIPFIGGALFIYALFLWINTFYEPFNLAAACMVTGFLAMVVTRFIDLHGLVRARRT